MSSSVAVLTVLRLTITAANRRRAEQLPRFAATCLQLPP